jgi:alkaline phosphatase D
MNLERRLFLARTTRLASLAAMAAAFPSALLSPVAASPQIATRLGSHYPFPLGVASGSPRPTSVVLWTRLIGDPLDTTPIADAPLPVRWEVADDDNFSRIVAKGVAAALPELAHSVHVDVTGLRPDRWYWYRFLFGDAVSPVARTRTAPAADALPAQLRFAFASCQHWEFGEYGAHRHIATSSPDLVAFLGDYIYEWGPYGLAHPEEPRARDIESFTLQDYRRRYAQYKTDRNLQASHHVAPWIVTWDDHEIANDYGNDRDERRDPDFLARRAAAYQAFYEHMPVRLGTLPDRADRFAFMRIHDRYDWGRLARFHVLDDRQYRSYHACQPPDRGGSSSVTSSCAERTQPERTLLGREQETWLAEGFASSNARWNILAQQTLMAQCSQVPAHAEGEGRYWTDGWDGYPAARARLFDDIVKYRPANPLVIGGDVHTFYAADLKRDFFQPASAANPVIATEFCGTSVTSSSRPQARTDQYLVDNPHIRFGRSDRRGWVMVEMTPQRTTTHFQALDNVHDANSGFATIARFVVEDGRAGVVRDA